MPKVSLLVALVCALLLLAPEDLGAALAYDRQLVLDGQLWRLWSAHLVHFSLRHALFDGAVLVVLGMALEPALGARRMALALALAAPVITLALLVLVPQMTHYRGASGLGMMLAVGAGGLLWRSNPGHRPLLVLLGLALVARLGADMLDLGDAVTTLPSWVAIAWQAHLVGAACGVALTWRRATAVN